MGSRIVSRELLESEALDTEAANYTLKSGDAEATVLFTKASAGTVTVPPQAAVDYPDGTIIRVVQAGAGQFTITAGAGVTIQHAAATLKSLAQWGKVTLQNIGGDTWIANGDLAAS